MKEVLWCKTCLMPSSRPRVVFTDGVCNACRWAVEKKKIDWSARAAEFKKLITSQPKGQFDCVVPFSGGKDSAMIAWRLKFEHGLKPLLVTYGQLLWTEVGRYNFNKVCEAGFEIFYWRADQEVSRKLARRFFIERGHPKMHYDAAVNAVPLIVAKQFNIPLVFFAEHGETEYGGLVLSEEHRRTRKIDEVLENQVGDDARNWAGIDGITERDLYPYIYPDGVENIGVYYYSHFFPWDIYRNAVEARHILEFTQAKNRCWMNGSTPLWFGKSDGSFEGFDSIDDMIDDLDYYMMHVKFGFGRSARMASRLIQNGHTTRERGLELVRKHDGEFPETYLPQILDYLKMRKVELIGIVDQHRNPEIWTKEGGEWKLRNPPA